MADDKETGFKWWLRYVIVPLIGSGGTIAIMAAVINRPMPPTHPSVVNEQNNGTPAPKPAPQGNGPPTGGGASAKNDKTAENDKAKVGDGKLPDFYLRTTDGRIIKDGGSLKNGRTGIAYWDIKNPKGKLYYGCASTLFFELHRELEVQPKDSQNSEISCSNHVPCMLYCSLFEVNIDGLVVKHRVVRVNVTP